MIHACKGHVRASCTFYNTRTHTHTQIRTHTHTRRHADTTRTHTQVHTHTHTHTHAHTRTHTHRQLDTIPQRRKETLFPYMPASIQSKHSGWQAMTQTRSQHALQLRVYIYMCVCVYVCIHIYIRNELRRVYTCTCAESQSQNHRTPGVYVHFCYTYEHAYIHADPHTIKAPYRGNHESYAENYQPAYTYTNVCMCARWRACF